MIESLVSRALSLFTLRFPDKAMSAMPITSPGKFGKTPSEASLGWLVDSGTPGRQRWRSAHLYEMSSETITTRLVNILASGMKLAGQLIATFGTSSSDVMTVTLTSTGTEKPSVSTRTGSVSWPNSHPSKIVYGNGTQASRKD